MAAEDPNPAGLITLLRRIGETVLAIAQNRLELASVELGEEKCRLLEALFWLATFAFFAMMATAMITLAVILWLCDTTGGWIIAGFCAFYLAGAHSRLFFTQTPIRKLADAVRRHPGGVQKGSSVFAFPELDQLQARKQELLLESELHRRTFELQWQGLKASLSWMRTGIELVQSLQPLWVVLAPIAGFFIGRQWRSSVGWWRKALFVWRLRKKIYLAWNFLRPSAPTPPKA